MRFGNNSFTLKKKKRSIPSLEALKAVSLVTGSILAMNKVLKEKVMEQKNILTKSRRKKSTDPAAIIAGFIGGLLAGALTALLFAPEPGEKLRDRVGSFFTDADGELDLEKEMEEARQQAEEKLSINTNNN